MTENMIGTEGAMKISELLKKNTTLNKLGLSGVTKREEKKRKR